MAESIPGHSVRVWGRWTPSEMLALRQSRYYNFHTLQRYVASRFELFQEAWSKTAHAAFFSSVYSMHVEPADFDRHGIPVRDRHLIRVSFGSRAHADIRSKNLISEIGAELSYELLHDGAVAVSIWASKHRSYNAIESGIILRVERNALQLHEFALQRDWKTLLSYMAVTSMDGAPRKRDQLRIFWHRTFGQRVVDRRIQPIRWLSTLREVAKWVAMVGLSGTVLYGIQWIFPLPETITGAVNCARDTAHEDSQAIIASIESSKDRRMGVKQVVAPCPKPKVRK